MAKKKVPKAVANVFSEAANIFREAYKSAPAEVKQYFQEVGRKGGLAGGSRGGKMAAAKMTPKQRIERARKAGAASAKARSAALRKLKGKAIE